MKEALFYRTRDDGKVECLLCPDNCIIAEGKRGACKVRRNEKGRLIAENYGLVSAVHVDPIEKKPLYHFFPGRPILSLGTAGCNLHCLFCQNWEISQATVEEIPLQELPPATAVETALKIPDNIGIAYTYNEPVIWYEYVRDTALLAHKEGLKNVMVTNGYVYPEPLRELLPLIDAFSVDLKGFNEHFYKRYTLSRLQPVLETLKIIRGAGRHLEITNLVVPELNDDEEEFERMTDWIVTELGRETILHISRYFPAWKMHNAPTPVSTLKKFYEIASRKLDYVFLGNVSPLEEGQDTVCPQCGATVIRRSGYRTEITGLDKQGRCTQCGKKIIGTMNEEEQSSKNIN
jgi:pyruvate formate lyase activating enzyme